MNADIVHGNEANKPLSCPFLPLSPTPRFIPLLLLFVSTLACAEVRVQVLETDPGSPATLGHWQQFYLRIAYETDRPIRVRAEAYAGGAPVPSTNSGSPRYGPGPGEAMFWIAYTEPARVDRIVVRAVDDKTQQPIAQAEIAVDLAWTGQKTAARRRKPEWAARLQAERDRLQKEAMREYASRPSPWWESVLFMAAMWSIPIYFIVQVVALRRWRGGWRIAAAVPAVPMALILGHAIFAFFAGSNIFPIVLVFTCLPALVYLLALMVLRRFLRQPA
jgi:hypothetical protein